MTSTGKVCVQGGGTGQDVAPSLAAGLYLERKQAGTRAIQASQGRQASTTAGTRSRDDNGKTESDAR